jgi:hypothetical protein
VGYELRHIAEQGACVIATVLSNHLPLLSPAATLAVELEARAAPAAEADPRLRKLGARTLLLKVTKNRVGSTGEVPVSFIPGAGTVEETRP